MKPLTPDQARELEESHQRFLQMELIELQSSYEDQRRYQDEIDLYNTKGEYSHTEVKPQ